MDRLFSAGTLCLGLYHTFFHYIIFGKKTLFVKIKIRRLKPIELEVNLAVSGNRNEHTKQKRNVAAEMNNLLSTNNEKRKPQAKRN